MRRVIASAFPKLDGHVTVVRSETLIDVQESENLGILTRYTRTVQHLTISDVEIARTVLQPSYSMEPDQSVTYASSNAQGRRRGSPTVRGDINSQLTSHRVLRSNPTNEKFKI